MGKIVQYFSQIVCRGTYISMLVIAFAVVLSAYVAVMCGTGLFVKHAFADSVEDAQQQVEEATRQYNNITADINALEEHIASNQQSIQELEQRLPEQRAAAKESMVSLYKMQNEGCSLLDWLMGSVNVSEFLQNMNYIQRVQEKITSAFSTLISTVNQLQDNARRLEEDKGALLQQQQNAQVALQQAQEAHLLAQQAAKAKKEAEKQQPPAPPQEILPDANTGSMVANEPAQEQVTQQVQDDNANWEDEQASFVAGWAERINAYLSGTPLSGYGANFASAAWDYGVDPRWSPAISYVESSCGLYCFKSHNAWGWGSVSWGSWEEAIQAHVGGLSRGYGYTLTQAAAQKYCPPNWEHWYNSCAAQMNRI